MIAWDTLKSWTKEVALTFNGLAGSALKTPIIGNWCYVEFSNLYVFVMRVYIAEIEVGRWLDSAESRMAQILSWGTIRSYILGSWSWLNTIDDRIWSTAYSRITATWSWLNSVSAYAWGWVYPQIMARWSWLNSASSSVWGWVYPQITARWSWLNSIDDRIWSTAYSRITGTWSWLNTIDDRIRNTVTARWNWLNTIDDKIKHVAWDHIRPQLADWFWSFIVLEVTLVSKIGYRVISTLWNMEWDDDNKEAK